MLKFQIKNKYIVYFKDGNTLKSDGKSNSLEKCTIGSELNFLDFHINKEILFAGKSLSDVKSIEIKIDYKDE